MLLNIRNFIKNKISVVTTGFKSTWSHTTTNYVNKLNFSKNIFLFKFDVRNLLVFFLLFVLVGAYVHILFYFLVITLDFFLFVGALVALATSFILFVSIIPLLNFFFLFNFYFVDVLHFVFSDIAFFLLEMTLFLFVFIFRINIDWLNASSNNKKIVYTTYDDTTAFSGNTVNSLILLRDVFVMSELLHVTSFNITNANLSSINLVHDITNRNRSSFLALELRTILNSNISAKFSSSAELAKFTDRIFLSTGSTGCYQNSINMFINSRSLTSNSFFWGMFRTNFFFNSLFFKTCAYNVVNNNTFLKKSMKIDLFV